MTKRKRGIIPPNYSISIFTSLWKTLISGTYKYKYVVENWKTEFNREHKIIDGCIKQIYYEAFYGPVWLVSWRKHNQIPIA